MPRRRKAWLVGGDGRRPPYPGYYVAWHEYVEGRRIHHTRNFLSQRDARRWCRQRNAAADLRALGDPPAITVTQAGEEFIASLVARTASTRQQYGISILKFASSCGNAVVSSIGRLEVDAFIAERLACSTAATVAKHCRGLRRFFGWCRKAGYLVGENPISLATAIPSGGQVRQKPVVTEVQFEHLLEALDTEDRKVAVLVAATTGLDRNVIRTMTVGDIDFTGRQFRLTRFKTHRLIYPHVHDDLLPRLRRLAAGKPSTHRLFSGLAREQRDGKQDWWHRAASAAGLPELQFRDLRTYAVNYLRSAVGDFEAQKIVGHSSPAVTAKHYWQADPSTQQRISKRPLPGTSRRRGKAKKRGA